MGVAEEARVERDVEEQQESVTEKGDLRRERQRGEGTECRERARKDLQ